ncbi:NAD(P)H-binding protein [Hufsiella ginkgonis]|uniref:NAD(P)H-binding protein n=1 Tax=Hufsiella ginkgonis TaxID=2695274 RepID=A0A7K1Y397_9SPHI|nr:NAD(P)H-binding protein [Hufsiella ginkgonis]MXV17740.1 NAD(P)H-binding protein [Hufsiella ginkgonis]
MKALIIGATGATGKDLTEILLSDPGYTEIVLFVRRFTGLVHPKLVEVMTDFDNLEAVSEYIRGDVWFSCLGTTLKAAGSQEKQRHIDYEIPAKFAGIAKRNGVRSTVLVSAYGASAKSNVFYSRIKGELEDYIAGLGFEQYIIFRPGLLLRKDSDRLGERIMAGVLRFLNGLGIIRKFRPMPTSTLVAKMAKAPHVTGAGKHVISLEKIFGS